MNLFLPNSILKYNFVTVFNKIFDSRTCKDFDECEIFKDKLCIGTCKNIPGSYACECPNGYKLGSDGRICLGNLLLYCRYFPYDNT